MQKTRTETTEAAELCDDRRIANRKVSTCNYHEHSLASTDLKRNHN